MCVESLVADHLVKVNVIDGMIDPVGSAYPLYQKPFTGGYSLRQEDALIVDKSTLRLFALQIFPKIPFIRAIKRIRHCMKFS